MLEETIRMALNSLDINYAEAGIALEYIDKQDKRIAELEAFAQYVLENSGERTMRDKADEILKR